MPRIPFYTMHSTTSTCKAIAAETFGRCGLGEGVNTAVLGSVMKRIDGFQNVFRHLQRTRQRQSSKSVRENGT